MAFQLGGAPTDASRWSNLMPDIGEAISKGYKQGMQPRVMAEELIKSKLANKIQSVKAQYAQQMEEAGLAHMLASTQGLGDAHGMAGLNRQLLQQKINQSNWEQNLNNSLFKNKNPMQNSGNDSGNDYGNDSFGGSDIPSIYPSEKPTAEDNVNDGMGARTSNKNVVFAGNKDLYHIDDMIDSSPQAAAYFKNKLGYQKKITTKVDPKTGMATVITQYPSGKVEMETSRAGGHAGNVPLTTKTISSLQSAKVALPQLRQVIDKLIESPSPAKLPYGIPWRPGASKEHDDLVNLGKDLFAKVKALTSTEHALKTGQQGNYSTDESYHKALLKTKALLDDDEKGIDSALGQGILTTQRPTSSKQSVKSDPLGIR
jgi:hypothetical protein